MDETARLTESIKELLGAGRAERLADVLEAAHAADVAMVLRELPLPDQVQELVGLLARELLDHVDDVIGRHPIEDARNLHLVEGAHQLGASRVIELGPTGAELFDMTYDEYLDSKKA